MTSGGGNPIKLVLAFISCIYKSSVISQATVFYHMLLCYDIMLGQSGSAAGSVPLFIISQSTLKYTAVGKRHPTARYTYLSKAACLGSDAFMDTALAHVLAILAN